MANQPPTRRASGGWERRRNGKAMETDTDLLIIGAGPYGLAMAGHAKHLGLDYPGWSETQ
jgi:NADPH-dependent 2,4-dienoyl-CoA reductase/sulfur reductase-like enzyme